jgi:uncharacterized protein YjbJ (UPF0337 family)
MTRASLEKGVEEAPPDPRPGPKTDSRRYLVGIADKASNKAEDLKGQAKEATGKATGDPDLRDEGKADQASSAVKDAGEKVKDAAKNLKDKLT